MFFGFLVRMEIWIGVGEGIDEMIIIQTLANEKVPRIDTLKSFHHEEMRQLLIGAPVTSNNFDS